MVLEQPHSPRSIKAAQLADLIRDLYAGYIQREVAGVFVTVTSVTVSPDLLYATVWLRVFPPVETERTLQRLQSAQRSFQNMLSKDLKRKMVPRVRLSIDTTQEDSEHINSLLNI
jgi:ribosome-binding factor A